MRFQRRMRVRRLCQQCVRSDLHDFRILLRQLDDGCDQSLLRIMPFGPDLQLQRSLRRSYGQLHKPRFEKMRLRQSLLVQFVQHARRYRPKLRQQYGYFNLSLLRELAPTANNRKRLRRWRLHPGYRMDEQAGLFGGRRSLFQQCLRHRFNAAGHFGFKVGRQLYLYSQDQRLAYDK